MRSSFLAALVLLSWAACLEPIPSRAGVPLAVNLQEPSAASSSDLAAAEALLQGKRYPEAMDRFEAALTLAPADARARRGYTEAAITWSAQEALQRHTDESMQILERAMQRLPDQPELLVSFGLEALELGQLPIAEQALHAADKLKPGDPTTTYALARLEIEEQHLPDAERDLKAYLATKPNDATAYFGLGHVYAMEQRNEEARKAFQASVRLQPRQTESYYQLGQIDLNLQQDAEARGSFERVLARDPNHAGALTGMGQLALRSRQYAEAEEWLAKAEKSDSGYPPTHYYRGLALAKLGRAAEAQQELRAGDSRPHASAPESSSP